MNILLVVDGNGLMHRAYHALPPFKTAKGIPTHVVYGFFSILHKSILDFQPTHLVVCFDTPARTFRNELHKEYQSQRPKIADDFIQQIPMVKEVLTAGNIVHLEKDGYEGDDVIGTVTVRGEKEGFQVLILTGDKDMMQLINPHVSTVTPDIGFSKTKVYTETEVVAKMGVPPNQIIDLKALTGDPSDNYKGADGIGPKTAQKLLQEYQSVDNILAHVDELPEGRIKDNIRNGVEDIKIGKKLATILTDVPLSFDLESAKWNGFSETLKTKLLEYEMYSLAGRLFPKQKKAAVKKKVVEENTDQISMF